MSVLLIAPSNTLYMPYLENYIYIFNQYNIQFDLIVWDRFGIENNESYNKFRDEKIGHKRNFVDYLNYSKFIKPFLLKQEYDGVIVFSIQLAFFLSKILQRNYKKRYILDIRDKNALIHFMNIGRLIRYSYGTVISSPGYLKWLPRNHNYIINHNFNRKDEYHYRRFKLDIPEKIDIAYIGAIRDYKINQKFINSVKNSKRILISFHGNGKINTKINSFIKKNEIKNVFLSGEYKRNEEEKLYLNSDIINVLRYCDSINNETALPNRLYKGPFFRKPLLAYEGTFLASTIKKYGIGLIVNSFKDIEEEIIHYLDDLDYKEFDKNCKNFLSMIVKENDHFEKSIYNFISNIKELV